MKGSTCMVWMAVATWLTTAAPVLEAAEAPSPPATRNPVAVEEVRAGTRKVANAAWWGFNREDATECLQSALDSGAGSVTVPYQGTPWIVRPVRLPSGQEITLEPGVVILAKKGEFQGPGDSLFTATAQSNLVIRGYGATLRMHKRDYQQPPYKPAEWRMGVALRGCRHVLIEGLRVESTGGDGFYIDGGGDLGWSEDITLRNCAASDNHRQGVSVISAVGLVIENCVFSRTWGTAPEAGIDFEPDTEAQRLVHCLVRNSIFENNNGHQILVYLKPLTTNSQPVSIRFENCLARMTGERFRLGDQAPPKGIRGVAGIAVGEVKDNGPSGLIEFVHCVTENTAAEGARIYDKSAERAQVRFIDCSFSKPWSSAADRPEAPQAAILIELRHPELTARPGGIEFLNCLVHDNLSRPGIWFEEPKGEISLRDLSGEIFVAAPGSIIPHWGAKPTNVTLKLAPIP